jgi:chromosome segregation ATPase
MAIIKFFILSPVEKNYIKKIEDELSEGDKLDRKIKELNTEIEKANEKKQIDTRSKQTGKENPEKLLKEIAVHENKLEKAHQKLNTTISQNTQLREKINVLRKEKNVIEDIYTKLKKELEEKKSSIENTIVEAGRAYINRNTAENELKVFSPKSPIKYFQLDITGKSREAKGAIRKRVQ